jgi:hypothetical protein
VFLEKKYYPLHIWALVVFISPTIIYLFFLLKDLPQINFRFADLLFTVIVFMIGAIFMLPAFFIYSFIFDHALKKRLSSFHQKFIPLFGAAIAIFATYYLLISKIFGILFDNEEMIFPITYTLTLIFTSLVYRMKTETKFSRKKGIE